MRLWHREAQLILDPDTGSSLSVFKAIPLQNNLSGGKRTKEKRGQWLKSGTRLPRGLDQIKITKVSTRDPEKDSAKKYPDVVRSDSDNQESQPAKGVHQSPNLHRDDSNGTRWEDKTNPTHRKR